MADSENKSAEVFTHVHQIEGDQKTQKFTLDYEKAANNGVSIEDYSNGGTTFEEKTKKGWVKVDMPLQGKSPMANTTEIKIDNAGNKITVDLREEPGLPSEMQVAFHGLINESGKFTSEIKGVGEVATYAYADDNKSDYAQRLLDVIKKAKVDGVLSNEESAAVTSLAKEAINYQSQDANLTSEQIKAVKDYIEPEAPGATPASQANAPTQHNR